MLCRFLRSAAASPRRSQAGASSRAAQLARFPARLSSRTRTRCIPSPFLSLNHQFTSFTAAGAMEDFGQVVSLTARIREVLLSYPGARVIEQSDLGRI